MGRRPVRTCGAYCISVAIGWQSGSGFEFCSLLLLPRSLNFLSSGRGETVDAADLKSAPRKGVWVRLPSSAPTQRSQCTEDAPEPRSPARISRGNVSLLTGLDRRTRFVA